MQVEKFNKQGDDIKSKQNIIKDKCDNLINQLKEI